MKNPPFFCIQSLARLTFSLAIVQLGFPDRTHAQYTLRGFVDSYHAVRAQSPNDYLSSRNRVRLEMFAENETGLAFLSMNAMENNVLESQSGVELREAYLEYASDRWDMRIGRQIVVWGKADGVQITDMVSPMDYTEFLARDYDDIRIPVNAFKVRYLRDKVTLEVIWLPVFQSAILPEGDNPWAVASDFPENLEVIYDDPLEPERTFENSEIGGKISFYLPGVDLSFSGLYTWDKFPIYHVTDVSESRMRIREEYHRLTFIGGAFSIPKNAFVFRGETAFFAGKRIETDVMPGNLLKRNTWEWLLGVDWYAGSDWTLSAQITDTFILDYENAMTDDSHTVFSTWNISRKFLRETLTLSTFAYVGMNHGDFFDRCTVNYALTDELHLSAGIDWFSGNQGMFGQYNENSEFWIKAKYSF